MRLMTRSPLQYELILIGSPDAPVWLHITRIFGDELRRCAEELGFRAVKLQPQYHGLNPVSRNSDFFFEAALEHKLPVVVHTGAGAPFALPSSLHRAGLRFPDWLSCSAMPEEVCIC